MKKIILVVLLAFSLEAGSLMCADSYERFQKYTKLVHFAYERRDFVAMKMSVEMEILYAERALANCGDDWLLKDSVSKIRIAAIEISKELEKLIKK